MVNTAIAFGRVGEDALPEHRRKAQRSGQPDQTPAPLAEGMAMPEITQHRQDHQRPAAAQQCAPPDLRG